MKKLIGGGALRELGSSRHTEDKDYLVFYENSKEMFIKEDGGDLINANGHPFFKEIYENEKNKISELATPQSLMELCCFAFVQHCLNGFWQKVDDKEYDIKFLKRKYNVEPKIVQKYITEGQMKEIKKILDNVR